MEEVKDKKKTEAGVKKALSIRPTPEQHKEVQTLDQELVLACIQTCVEVTA
jgi:hypothetical protein